MGYFPGSFVVVSYWDSNRSLSNQKQHTSLSCNSLRWRINTTFDCLFVFYST